MLIFITKYRCTVNINNDVDKLIISPEFTYVWLILTNIIHLYVLIYL